MRGSHLALPDEVWEDIYKDWAAGDLTVAQVAAKYGIHEQTLKKRRAKDNWVHRNALEKLENIKGKRQVADEALVDALPAAMRKMIWLSQNAESESIQLQATKYLLGTSGYSPEASEQWLKGIEAKLAQMAEQQRAEQETAQAPEDLSSYFSDAIDLSPVVGTQYPLNSSNGEPEEELVVGGEEVFEDWR